MDFTLTRFWKIQPFPMNPSFTPLTPISNTVKTKIYYEYTYDPQANSIRALSNRYGISIKRIDAIIRLKQLEEQWTKVCLKFLLFLIRSRLWWVYKRLVLKTNHMVKNSLHAWLSDHPHCFLKFWNKLWTDVFLHRFVCNNCIDP